MAGQTPLWKKEIKLRNRSGAAVSDASVDDPEGQTPSIWKKEIKLSKNKRKKEKTPNAAISVSEPGPERSSIWKKELRFRRSVPVSREAAEPVSKLDPATNVAPPESTNGHVAVEREALMLADPPAPPSFARPTAISSGLAPLAPVNPAPVEPAAVEPTIPIPEPYRQPEPMWPGASDDIAAEPPAAIDDELNERLLHPDELPSAQAEARVDDAAPTAGSLWSLDSWAAAAEPVPSAEPASEAEQAAGFPADSWRTAVEPSEIAEPTEPALAEPSHDQGEERESDSYTTAGSGFAGFALDTWMTVASPDSTSADSWQTAAEPTEVAEPAESEPAEASVDDGEASVFETFAWQTAAEPSEIAEPVESQPADPFGPLDEEDDFDFHTSVDPVFDGVPTESWPTSAEPSGLVEPPEPEPAEPSGQEHDERAFEPYAPVSFERDDRAEEDPVGTAPQSAFPSRYEDSPVSDGADQGSVDEPAEAPSRYTFGSEPEPSAEPESHEDVLGSGGAVTAEASFAAEAAWIEPGERDAPETAASDENGFSAVSLGEAAIAGSFVGIATEDEQGDSADAVGEPEGDEREATPVGVANSDEKADGSKKKKKKKSKSRGSSHQVVGVRIGSSQIMVSVVRNAGGDAELIQLASAPIERGVVVAGEVREPDALAAQLKAMFAKHKLPKKGIRLGIASNRVGVKTIEVPVIADEKALENAIRFRAQEVLSIPLTDAILDHVALGETETDEGRTLRVLLVFAHRELVDRYVDAFKKARLKVASIDFEAFALLRAIGSTNGDGPGDRATVAVSVGQERTIFAVAEGKVCDFTRVLEWGGGSLTVALARALNMTPSQAEPLKRTLSLDGGMENSDLSSAQIETARGAVQTELQVLARELLATLQFYQSRPGSLALGELLVTGGGLELKGAAEELQERLGVPVKVIDPFERVRAAKKTRVLDETGAAAIAIGLGMEA